MIRQRTDLIKYWSKLQRVVAEEGVHLFITLGWTSSKYLDKLRLRLLKGVLHYIEVVIALLLLTQSHRRKEPKKASFQKTTKIAPANNRNQTTKTNNYT